MFIVWYGHILRIFENWGANHKVVFLLFIVCFWVHSCYKMVIFIEFDHFGSTGVLRGVVILPRTTFWEILKIVVVCLIAHGKFF